VILLRPPVAVPARPPRAVLSSVRKIALCGSHSASLADAPWDDPSWEFWGHSSSRAWYARAMDRYFDLHPKACWTRAGKASAAYPKWLAQNTVPIYMQEHYDEVPASIKYPKGRILQEFSRPYFTNHVAWMIALALTEGVTAIGLFGINYGTESEYVMQRGSAEYWLGRAEQQGVKVVLPEQCTLLRDPGFLYGYESHDEVTGKIRPEYQQKAWKPAETIVPVLPGETWVRATPPKHLIEAIALEEKDYPRPEWAMGPMNGHGGAVANG
jgi:hypothetical protein